MKWVYTGGLYGGGHNGEYDWKCSNCKYETWYARYTDPNKEKVPCPECKEIPN